MHHITDTIVFIYQAFNWKALRAVFTSSGVLIGPMAVWISGSVCSHFFLDLHDYEEFIECRSIGGHVQELQYGLSMSNILEASVNNLYTDTLEYCVISRVGE